MATVAPESATALPYWSWTCTVTAGLMAVPAWVVVGCWTKPSLLAAAALTVMPLWVPVMDPVTVSVAVIDWVPAVLSVTEKTWVPASPPVKV